MSKLERAQVYAKRVQLGLASAEGVIYMKPLLEACGWIVRNYESAFQPDEMMHKTCPDALGIEMMNWEQEGYQLDGNGDLIPEEHWA
jgi:hypothetical protein